MKAELCLAAVSLVTGIRLMMLYDLLRIFRMLVKHGTLAVNLEDLSYFLYCGFRTFDMLYVYQNGIIRFYAIGAIGLGMFLYEKIVGRNLRNYLKKKWKSLRINLRKFVSLHKR